MEYYSEIKEASYQAAKRGNEELNAHDWSKRDANLKATYHTHSNYMTF